MENDVKLPIGKILILSALHVSPETRAGLINYIGQFDLTVYNKMNYGWFIYVDLEDTDLKLVPPDLLYLLRLAHINNCFYLELDMEYDPEPNQVLYEYYPLTERELFLLKSE